MPRKKAVKEVKSESITLVEKSDLVTIHLESAEYQRGVHLDYSKDIWTYTVSSIHDEDSSVTFANLDEAKAVAEEIIKHVNQLKGN